MCATVTHGPFDGCAQVFFVDHNSFDFLRFPLWGLWDDSRRLVFGSLLLFLRSAAFLGLWTNFKLTLSISPPFCTNHQRCHTLECSSFGLKRWLDQYKLAT
jgi:hypothetical protein